MNPNLKGFVGWLGLNSIAAVLLVGLVLLTLALMGRRLSAAWRHRLWFLVVVRLVLPWAPESSFSVSGLIPVAWRQAALAAPTKPTRVARSPEGWSTPEPGPRSESKAVDVVIPASDASSVGSRAVARGSPLSPVATVVPIVPAPTSPELASRTANSVSADGMSVLGALWALGVALVLMRLVIQNVLFLRRIRLSSMPADAAMQKLFAECRNDLRVRTHIELLESGHISSPAIYGLFRPRLLLPQGIGAVLDTTQIRHVFLHELAHLRRRDLWTNALLVVVQTLHWFNPIVWVAFHRMRLDRELAADELALSVVGQGAALGYGQTIVRVLETFSRSDLHPASIGILEEANQVAQRMRAIVRYRQPSRWAALGIVPALVLAWVGWTEGTSAGTEATARPVVGNTASAATTAANTLRSQAVAADASTGTVSAARVEPPTGRASSTPSPTGAAYGGTVVDNTGQPLAHARVQVGWRGRFADPTQGNASATVETDAGGHWLVRGFEDGEVPLTLVATHPEFLSGIFQVSTDGTPGDGTVLRGELRSGRAVLRLSPGRLVEGRVVSESGRAIAKATVRLMPDGGSAEPPRTALTDAEGVFRFTALDTGSMHLSAEAQGFSRTESSLQIAAGLGPVELRLSPGRTLRGVVMDRDRPVSAALVSVLGTRINTNTYSVLDQMFRAQLDRQRVVPNGPVAALGPGAGPATMTGPEGLFVLDDVPADSVLLGIAAEGYASRTELVGVKATHEIRITLEPDFHFMGRVLDADTGQAITDFTVWQSQGFEFPDSEDLSEEVWSRVSVAPEDVRQGWYDLPHYRPAGTPFRFVVTAPGRKGGISPPLTPQGSREYSFLLRKGSDLTGVLTLPSGQPVQHAQVVYPSFQFVELKDGVLRSGGPPIAQTDAGGRFALPPMIPKARIVAAHPELGFVDFDASELEGGNPIVLKPYGSVTGSARIAGMVRTNTTVWISPERRAVSWSSLVAICSCRPAADGSFTFDRLPAGRWSLQFQSDADPSTRGAHGMVRFQRLVEVRAGEVTEVHWGEVGRPVVGRVVPSDTNRVVAWSTGAHSLRRLVPGMDATAPSSLPALRDWLHRPEIKDGRLRERWHGVDWQPDGRFRIEDVEPGEYVLSLIFLSRDPLFDPESAAPIRVFGGTTNTVSVPGIVGARSDEAFDVGDLEVHFSGADR